MSKTRKGKKNKISVFSPGHKRAFCFIDDAVDQIIKLSFNNKINNEIFNIGNMSEEISMINLAKKIREFFTHKNSFKKWKNH